VTFAIGPTLDSPAAHHHCRCRSRMLFPQSSTHSTRQFPRSNDRHHQRVDLARPWPGRGARGSARASWPGACQGRPSGECHGSPVIALPSVRALASHIHTESVSGLVRDGRESAISTAARRPPAERRLLLSHGAISQVEINEMLIGQAGTHRQLLEICHGISIETDRDRLLQ